MTIFVVYGETGEHSAHIHWPVKGFKDEKKAKTLVQKATEYARTLFLNHPYRWTQEPAHFKSPHDPNLLMDYNGTRYYYEAIELENNGG